MILTNLSRIAQSCRLPAGVAAAASVTPLFYAGQQGSLNTSQRFASSASNATANILLKKAAPKTVQPPQPSPPIAQKKNLIEWYESNLQSNPVRTKMVSGGFLWGLGDVVAQAVPALFPQQEKINGKNDMDADVATRKSNPQNSFQFNDFMLSYDYARTGRAVFFGTLIHAPTAHVHYNFLETLTIKSGLSGLSIPVFKAFVEQFVYWSWFSNTLYHGAMGAMQGHQFDQIYQHISDVLWDTQKAQWAFWIPIQLVNFRFVPVRHQLNVVLITSVVWTALLSAWYPPSDTSNTEKESGSIKQK